LGSERRRRRRRNRHCDGTGSCADLDEGLDRQFGSGAKVGWYCAEHDGDCRRAPERTFAHLDMLARAENKGLCWIVERDLGDDSSLTYRDFPSRLRSQYGVEMLTDLKVELTYGSR
jgi:hypothetical protein